MRSMFYQAVMFDQPLDSWDVSSVTDMSWMLCGASNFNQPLDGWNVSSVINMRSMFYNAEIFNQNLCKWFELEYQELPFVLFMFGGTDCADTADPNFVTKKSFCGMCASV